MWTQFLIDSMFFLIGFNFLSFKSYKFFKQHKLVRVYKILMIFVFLINVFMFTGIFKNIIYLNDFKNLPHHQINKVIVNDSIQIDIGNAFLMELKSGEYYFQSHRVQDIEKKWHIDIISKDNKFELLVENTYKYGYTVYLIRKNNEVTHYKNNNLIQFLN